MDIFWRWKNFIVGVLSMSRYTNINVLHHLNKPLRFLSFPLLDAVLYATAFVGGLVLTCLSSDPRILVGVLVFDLLHYYGVNKYRQKYNSTGDLAKFVYRYLPFSGRMPSSTVKEYQT